MNTDDIPAAESGEGFDDDPISALESMMSFDDDDDDEPLPFESDFR